MEQEEAPAQATPTESSLPDRNRMDIESVPDEEASELTIEDYRKVRLQFDHTNDLLDKIGAEGKA